jgi:hypothetical protein
VAFAAAALFRPEAGHGLNGACGLQLPDGTVRLGVTDGVLETALGSGTKSDFTVSGEPAAVLGLLTGRLGLNAAGVKIEGDRAALQRFLSMFRVFDAGEDPAETEPSLSMLHLLARARQKPVG